MTVRRFGHVGLPGPKGDIVVSFEEAREVAREIGYQWQSSL